MKVKARTGLLTGLLASTAAVSITALGAGPAKAADAETTEVHTSVAEVVVTARGREENLQSVPIAITAFGDEQLKEQHIVHSGDLQYNTPSLVMGTNGSNHTFGTPTIRGLGTAQFGLQNVNTYFSEANSLSPNTGGALFDLSSVQVLKGPQGTLFGRASTAGAIILTPKHPDMQNYEGMAHLVLGSLGRVEGTAAVSMPFIPGHLAVRAAFHAQHVDGYTHPLDPTLPDLDEVESRSLRIGVEFRPGDGTFQNYFVAQIDRYDSAAEGNVLVGANLPLFANLVTRAAYQAELDRVNASDDAKRFASVSSNVPSIVDGRLYQYIDIAQVDLGDMGFSKVSLKNIFSYQQGGFIAGHDVDGLSLPLSALVGGFLGDAVSNSGAVILGGGLPNRVLTISTRPYVKRVTDEFQINGVVGDNRLIWVLGAFYQNQPVAKNFDALGPRTAFFLGATGTWLGALSWDTDGFTREEAVFGQATLDFSGWLLDGLHFTGGVRRTRDRQEVTAVGGLTFPNASGAALAPAVPPAVLTTSITESTGTAWMLSLDWRANENLMVYVTTRHGYKGGGTNGSGLCSLAPDCKPTYQPETVQDVEVGAKIDFTVASVVGRINADVYSEDFSNFQAGQSRPLSPGINIPFVANVGTATLKGFEIEGTLVFGDRFELSGQYSYNTFDYDQFLGTDPLGLIPASTANPTDPRCAQVVFAIGATTGTCLIDQAGRNWGPIRSKGSVTARYHFPLDEAIGEVTASATVYAQGRRWFGSEIPRQIAALGPGIIDTISQKPYAVVNARLDWVGIYGSNVDAAIFVRNLTDKLYALSGVGTLPNAASGFFTKNYAEPRTWGVELGVKF